MRRVGKVDENLARKWLGRKRGAIPKPEVPLNLRCFSLQQLYEGKAMTPAPP